MKLTKIVVGIVVGIIVALIAVVCIVAVTSLGSTVSSSKAARPIETVIGRVT